MKKFICEHSIFNKFINVKNAVINIFFSLLVSCNKIIDSSDFHNDSDIYLPCLKFNGSGYLLYGTSPAQLTGDMTICAYFKGSGSGVIGSGIGRGGSSGKYDYALTINSNGVAEFRIATSSTSIQSVTYTLPTGFQNTTSHLMGVFSAGNYLRLFRNGVQVAELNIGVSPIQYCHVTNQFAVGALSDLSGRFVGIIYDARVYNTVKSYSEIIANDTTGIEFWDMLNSTPLLNYKIAWYGGISLKSLAITGQIGTMGGYYAEIDNFQNNARHTFGYTKVVFEDQKAFVPYSVNRVSQYATFSPVYDASETITEIPYDPAAIFQDWGERISFNDSLELKSSDGLAYLFKPDGTARLLDFPKLNSNIGDYYFVDSNGGSIYNISIIQEVKSYPEIDVHILWGQSNCVGVGESVPSSDLQGNLNSYVYTESGLQLLNWNTNNNQYNQKTTQHGIELELSRTLYSLNGRVNVILKCAYGNTGLQLNQGWELHYMFNWHDILCRAIEETMYWVVRDLKCKPIIKTFIQLQGENDAIHLSVASLYKGNLTAFYEYFRKFTGSNDFKVIIIKTATTAPQYPNVEVVRTAQQEYADEQSLAYIIDGRGYGIKADLVHHTSVGYNGIGIATANLIHSIL